MNKKAWIIVLVLIIGAVAYAQYRPKDVPVETVISHEDVVQEVKTPTPSVDTTEQTFSGKITAYSTGCFVDGICSVTVGDKVVIITAGFRMNVPPVGTLQGVESIGDLETKIGHTATVYAHKNSSKEYTLYGKASYYVKVQ